MDNWTHRQRQLIMDNHQLSNHNFNIFLKYILFYFHWTHGQPDTQTNKTFLSNSNFNILLKCILYLFSLDTWTNGHANKINF